MFTVNIRALIEDFDLQVQATTSIRDLKELIEEHCELRMDADWRGEYGGYPVGPPKGIPPDGQRLIFRGHSLKDEETLTDSGIGEGDRIHVVLRLGCGPASGPCLVEDRGFDIVPCPWELPHQPYDPICENWPCNRPIEVRFRFRNLFNEELFGWYTRSYVLTDGPFSAHLSITKKSTDDFVLVEDCGLLEGSNEDWGWQNENDDLPEDMVELFFPESGFEPDEEYYVSIASLDYPDDGLHWYFHTDDQPSIERARFAFFKVGEERLSIVCGEDVVVMKTSRSVICLLGEVDC